MAFFGSAFASAATISSRLLFSSSRIHKNVWSTKNKIMIVSMCTSNQKKNSLVIESLLHKHRKGRALTVTDLTSSEWCEKQVEYSLEYGQPKSTKAMKVGSARHASLEKEVVKKVKFKVKSDEDLWALKFINFIIRANQLISNGLTRELPLIGFTKGKWITGVIDEIRMPSNTQEAQNFPVLVDTKTRLQPTLPTEPQCRNGRLQLMCYKHLWDHLVDEKFPSKQFFEFFSLNPDSLLSVEMEVTIANSGFPAETLNDLVRHYRNIWCTLPIANKQLLLRYELQEDQSLIGEYEFAYDANWVNNQIQTSLEFWMGYREANYAPKEERWKCRICKFESKCRVTNYGD